MKKFLLMLFAFGLVLSVWAQDRVVTGKVTSNEDGSALPGVNVLVKGTTSGTVTDSEGKFSVSVPSSGGSLVFSFIGLTTQEVEIGERSVIDVQLGLDIKQLSEVVVTGTGVPTEKRKMAIAVESVTADKLPMAPTASIDQALIGKIAGAQIQATNGAPGAQINILLRGINTINTGTGPMILVDGVQMLATNLNAIDLSTVERVEVVQGAAAGTFYGAQGANGVIQIFTKKGREGQLDIDISSSVATNEYLNIGGLSKANLHGFETNSSNQVIGGAGTPLVQDPTTLVYDQNVIWNSTDPRVLINKPYDQNLKYHDHIKEFFTTANVINNSVAVRGGKGGTDYSFAVSNNHQESNFKGDGYNDRTNFTANVGMNLAKRLKFRSVTQLIYTKNTVDIYNKQDFGVNSLVYGIFNARPFVDYWAKLPTGDYAYYYGDASGVNQTNPNYTLEYNDTRDNRVDIMQSFNLNYSFPKFVDVDLKYGINHSDREVKYLAKNQTANANSVDQGAWVSWYGPDNTGEYTTFAYKTTFHNFLSTATFKFDFDKDFKLGIPVKWISTAAFDYRNRTFNRYITSGLGVPLDPPITANQANTYKVQDDYIEKFITYGYLLDTKFEYGELAGISGGIRSDYSSAFGGGSSPFTFPRANGYFRISALNFWDQSNISGTILEWKLRAAYGQAGVQPRAFDRYPVLSTRNLGGNNSLYTGPSQPNPNLNVEVSTETEVGTDITFVGLKEGSWLKNISISGTYWTRSTDNAIFDVEAAPSTGIGNVRDNAFGLSSSGWQASLNTTLMKTGDITWDFTVNFTKQASKIDKVRGGGQVVVTSNAGSTNYVLKAGDKIGQLYGYHLLKNLNEVDPVTGNTYLTAAEQASGNYVVASNGYVVDNTPITVSGPTATVPSKTPYFTAGQYSFGDPYANFNMAFISNFTYKGFLTVGVQMDWVSGNHLYNQTKEWMYRDGIHMDYTKPITIAGETGAFSSFYRGIYANRSRNGTKDYFYEDASFLRLRNVQVGVDFAKLFKIAKMKKLQLVLTGRNLWTDTKYTGMDPEISSGTVNSAWDRGTDHNTLPNFKTYQATLNIGL